MTAFQVTQASDLKLLVLLPPSVKSWDYKNVCLHTQITAVFWSVDFDVLESEDLYRA